MCDERDRLEFSSDESGTRRARPEGMTLRTFTIAVSLVALSGCVNDIIGDDDDDQDQQEESRKSEQAVMKTRHDTVKNTIGNVR